MTDTTSLNTSFFSSTSNALSKPLAKDICTFAFSFVLVGYLSWISRYFQLDDALIYLRYIRNLFEGYGLVYNPGELFNCLTSPLFTYLLIALNFLIRDLHVVAIGSCFILLSLAVGFLAKSLSDSLPARLLIIFHVGSFNFFYMTYGMETPLFLFLTALSFFLYINNRFLLVGIVLGLTFLTRSEGIFVSVILMADYILRHRKLPHFKYFVIPTLLVLASLLFNYFYYGHFLPTTGNAKMGQGESGFWGQGFVFLIVEYMYDWFFVGSTFLLVFLAASAAVGLLLNIRERIVQLMTAYIVVLGAFYVGINVPNYHWYYAPFYFFGLGFSALGIWSVTTLILKNFRLENAIIPLAIILGLYGAAEKVSLQKSIEPLMPHQQYKAAGTWLRDNTPKDAKLAMVEIGHLGWYSERYIIDILGLTNPFNADYIGQSDLYSWLKHYQPDFILIHDPIWKVEESATMLMKEGIYVTYPAFQLQGLKLLKKAREFSTEEISSIIEEHRSEERLLESMAKSSKQEAPFVMVEGGMLHAHAPTTFTYTPDETVTRVSFSYGIREGGADKHQGLCYRVYPHSLDHPPLFEDCITRSHTPNQQMFKASINIQSGEQTPLIFAVTCPNGCEYAWSFWRDFEFE